MLGLPCGHLGNQEPFTSWLSTLHSVLDGNEAGDYMQEAWMGHAWAFITYTDM